MFVESLKTGFSAAIRTWQAVLVQLVAGVLYGLGFVVVVLLPALVIAASVVGMNMDGLESLAAAGPDEILAFVLEHILAVILLAGIFFLYLLIVTTAALFVFGGILGVIGRATRVPDYRFSLRSFMEEGRRLFWRVMWLTGLIGLVAMGLGVILILFGAVGVAVLSPLAASETTAGKFVAIFSSLIGFSVFLAAVVAFAAWSSWSFVALAARNLRVMEAASEGLRVVVGVPASNLMYLGVTGLYLMTAVGVSLLLFVFGFIPVVGILILIPGQILYYGFERFMTLWLFGALFNYYFDIRGLRPEPENPPDEPLGRLPEPVFGFPAKQETLFDQRDTAFRPDSPE